MKKNAPYLNHQHAVKALCDGDFKIKHDVQELLTLLDVEMPLVDNAF